MKIIKQFKAIAKWAYNKSEVNEDVIIYTRHSSFATIGNGSVQEQMTCARAKAVQSANNILNETTENK